MLYPEKKFKYDMYYNDEYITEDIDTLISKLETEFGESVFFLMQPKVVGMTVDGEMIMHCIDYMVKGLGGGMHGCTNFIIEDDVMNIRYPVFSLKLLATRYTNKVHKIILQSTMYADDFSVYREYGALALMPIDRYEYNFHTHEFTNIYDDDLTIPYYNRPPIEVNKLNWVAQVVIATKILDEWVRKRENMKG